MILITGATGSLGRSTIEFLLDKIPSNQIVALARDEKKAADFRAKGIEVRIGDYDDKNSLIAGFKEIDKLFFISGNNIAEREKQHENVVNAAREARIKHIVYTSFARKNETKDTPLGLVATSHIATDKLIKESGIPFTIMLNTLYAETLPMFFGEKFLETGIFLPAGDGKAAYATRQDIAEAAANILTTEGHENREYVIANTKNYSLHDVAEILSELSGQHVIYSSPTREVYSNTLLSAGVPQEYIGVFSSFSEAIKQGEFETPVTDLKKLLGREPSTLKNYFRSIFLSNN